MAEAQTKPRRWWMWPISFSGGSAPQMTYNGSDVYPPWYLWANFSFNGKTFGKGTFSIAPAEDVLVSINPNWVSATQITAIVKDRRTHNYFMLYDDAYVPPAHQTADASLKTCGAISFWYYEQTLKEMDGCAEILLRQDVFQSQAWRFSGLNDPQPPIVRRAGLNSPWLGVSTNYVPDPMLDFSKMAPQPAAIATYNQSDSDDMTYASTRIALNESDFPSDWTGGESGTGYYNFWGTAKTLPLGFTLYNNKDSETRAVCRYYVFEFPQIENVVETDYAPNEAYDLFTAPQNPKYYFFPVFDYDDKGSYIRCKGRYYLETTSDQNKHRLLPKANAANPMALSDNWCYSVVDGYWCGTGTAYLNVLRSMYPNNFKGIFTIPVMPFRQAHIIDFLYFWLPLHVADSGNTDSVFTDEYWQNSENSLDTAQYANVAQSASTLGLPYAPIKFFAFELDVGVNPGFAQLLNWDPMKNDALPDTPVADPSNPVDKYIIGKSPWVGSTHIVGDDVYRLTPDACWFDDGGLTLAFTDIPQLGENVLNFGGTLPTAVTSYDDFVNKNRQVMDSGKNQQKKDAIVNGVFGLLGASLSGASNASNALEEGNVFGAVTAGAQSVLNIGKTAYGMANAYMNADREYGAKLASSFASSTAQNMSAPPEQTIISSYYQKPVPQGGQPNFDWASGSWLYARVPKDNYLLTARRIINLYGAYVNQAVPEAWSLFTEMPSVYVSSQAYGFTDATPLALDADWPDPEISRAFNGESRELADAFKAFMGNPLRV